MTRTRTEKQKTASRRNGRLGGRPVGTRGPNACTRYPSHRFNLAGVCYGCKYKRPDSAPNPSRET